MGDDEGWFRYPSAEARSTSTRGTFTLAIDDTSSTQNFRLRDLTWGGTRVNRATTVTDQSEECWTVTLEVGEYEWISDGDQNGFLRGLLTAHPNPNPPPPPPPPSPAGPPPPPPPPVQPDLIFTVGLDARIAAFYADGRRLTNLPPGTYNVQVHDLSASHNLHLTGPRIDEKTSVADIEHPIWRLTFRRTPARSQVQGAAGDRQGSVQGEALDPRSSLFGSAARSACATCARSVRTAASSARAREPAARSRSGPGSTWSSAAALGRAANPVFGGSRCPAGGLDSGAWMEGLRRNPARKGNWPRAIGDPTPLAALVAVQVDRPLALLALVATIVTLVLLVPMLRRPKEPEIPPATGHKERRRAPVTGRREAREALALVGEALAATHNPRALMPVILNVITEATGARGGRLLHEGEEVGWVGDLDGESRAVEFDLSAGDETAAMTLVLNPPEGGFSDETMKLAEWLSSQAAIALENARLHDIVQWQAITDELTGLVNRRRFLDALHSEIARGKRLGGRLSVVLADLDGFKEVNDRFGHHAGDEVLIAFADLLRAHGRDVDVAARLGGEEFAVILPETGLDGASTVADRLRRSLADLRIPLGVGEKVTVTASFGVAELGESQSVDALLRAADSALYRAKAHGKNRVELADADAA